MATSGKGMELRKELIKQCQRLIDAYKPSMMTPSTHVDDFCKENKLRDMNTVLFLREVMYGTQRYAKLLKVLVDGLYARHPSQVNRLDRTLYVIITYLTMFRIGELTFPEYRRIVKALEPHKMHVFFHFLFDEDMMSTWLRDQLLTVYDYRFVDDELFGTPENRRGVCRYYDEIRALIKELDDYLRPSTGAPGATTDGKKESKDLKFTKTKPFRLTQPKPRPVPKPKEMKVKIAARPIPDSLNQTSLARIEELRVKKSKARRKVFADKYKSAENDKILARLTDEQVRKNKALKQKIRSKIDAKVKQSMLSASQQPHAIKTRKYYEKVKNRKQGPFEAKPTTAAILREDAMYREQQRREAEMIRQYEVGLRDRSEFDAWRAREAEREAREEEEYKKRKREELVAMAETAKKAVEEIEKGKRESAVAQKEEAARALELLEIERQHEIAENQKRTLEVQKTREKALAAVAEVEKQRKLVAAAVQADLEEKRKLREQRAEAEMKQKKQLIKEIQAMVAEALVKSKAVREFDPTSTSGVGLLQEMSLDELHERLSILKEKEEREEREKRSQIISRRETKKEQIAIKLRRLERLRKVKAGAGVVRRDVAKRSALEIAANLRERREGQVVKMHAKLEKQREKKRSEALRLAKELKTRQIANEFLDADAAKVEEKKWKQLQAGKGRRAEVVQALKQAEQIRRRNIKSKADRQRGLNRTRVARKTKKFYRDVGRVTEKGLRRIERRKQAEDMVTTLNARNVKSVKQSQFAKKYESRTYETSMNRTQLRNARETYMTRTFGSTAYTSTRTLSNAGRSILRSE